MEESDYFYNWNFSNIIPLAKVFLPEEKVLVCIIHRTNMPNKLFLELHKEENLLFKQEVHVSANGMGLEEIDPLPEGEYSLKLSTHEEGFLTEATFLIQAYSRSLLIADWDLKEEDDGRYKTKVQLKRMDGTPFSGKVNCKIDKISFPSDVKDGSLHLYLDYLDYYPTKIEIIDEFGNSVNFLLPGNKHASKEELNNFGTIYSASSLPSPNSTPTPYGFYLETSPKDEEDRKGLFELGSPFFSRTEPFIRVEANTKFLSARALTFTPNLGFQVFDFSYNSELRIPAEYPFTVLKMLVTFPDQTTERLSAICYGEENLLGKVEVPTEITEPIIKCKVNLNQKVDVILRLSPSTAPTVGFKEKITKSYIGQWNDYYEKFYIYGDLKNIFPDKNPEFRFRRIRWYFRQISEKLGYGLSLVLFFPFVLLFLLLEKLMTPAERLEDRTQMMREAALRLHEDAEFSMDAMLLHELENSNGQDTERSYNATVIAAHLWENVESFQDQLEGITDIGELELTVFAFNGSAIFEEKRKIVYKKENYTLVKLPPFVSDTPGVSFAEVVTFPSGQGIFTMEKSSELLFKEKVQFGNRFQIPTRGAGQYEFTLLGADSRILDKFLGKTEKFGEITFLRSKVHILTPKAGENLLENGRYTVYPNLKQLRIEAAKSLSKYPYGCAEQIFASLFGLGMIWKEISEGTLTETEEINRKDLKKKIQIGILKLKEYQKKEFHDFIWGFFYKSSASLEVSAQCLLHCAPFMQGELSLAFPDLVNFANKTSTALEGKEFRDNRLLGFSKKFKEYDYKTPESAAAEILFSGQNEKALDYLDATSKVKAGAKYWKGRSLGRDVQTTALVTRALYQAGDKNWILGWKYLQDQFYGNKFFGTADSAELISLLQVLSPSLDSEIQIGSVKLELSSMREPVQTEKLLCQKGIAFVREDFVETIRLLDVQSTLGFQISQVPERISLYSKLKIEVASDRNRCLMARVQSTGKLLGLSAGVTLTSQELPLKAGRAEWEWTAVETGRLELQIFIFDLYDPSAMGVSPIFTIEIY